MTDQRTAFEAFAELHNASVTTIGAVYLDAAVEFAWMAWQAAIEYTSSQKGDE